MKEHTVEVYKDGSKRYYLDGKLHREDGPAFEHANGRKDWYLNGERHREDGPAIEWADGTKFWYLNGQRHREDGPAVEWSDGSKEWRVKGQLHREDGPAVEWSDGTKKWWLHNKRVTEQEHKRRTRLTMDDALEETDRLRAKKKQIYEDLQDAVEREWVGLTDEERYLGDVRSEEEIEYARAIEAKLKEKNA